MGLIAVTVLFSWTASGLVVTAGCVVRFLSFSFTLISWFTAVDEIFLSRKTYSRES